jgi:hypothetical protein
MVFVTDPVSPVVTAVPVTAGMVNVFVPATAGTETVIVPELDPFKNTLLPEANSTCSELVHAFVASTQLKVLSVVPFNVIPPPSAVAFEGEETDPNSMFLSSTVRVVELMVTVEPFTVKSPLKVKLAAFTVPVNVGLAENTNVPVPVSSVMAEIRLALVGVAKNVATPVPRPDTPVAMGNPVQLVNVPELGVPSIGVVSVGDVRVLLVNVCVPVNVATVESIANVPVVNVNPVPAAR